MTNVAGKAIPPLFELDYNEILDFTFSAPSTTTPSNSAALKNGADGLYNASPSNLRASGIRQQR